MPKAPRRVSGPLQGRAYQPTAPRKAAPLREPRSAGGLVIPRAGAFVRALPDHVLLDRLVRGRFWIPLLGLMLAGIVAMQVEVLKLGASMGRSIQRATILESRNQLLRASVASLADEQRVERLAAAQGMVMPAPDGVGFLAARASGNVQRAIANIHAPNSQGFLSLLSSNGAVTTTPTPSAGAAASQPAAGSAASPSPALGAASSQTAASSPQTQPNSSTSQPQLGARSSSTIPPTSLPSSAGGSRPTGG